MTPAAPVITIPGRESSNGSNALRRCESLTAKWCARTKVERTNRIPCSPAMRKAIIRGHGTTRGRPWAALRHERRRGEDRLGAAGRSGGRSRSEGGGGDGGGRGLPEHGLRGLDRIGLEGGDRAGLGRDANLG